MFDSLKDSLGRFKSDVEDAAEEEEVSDEDADETAAAEAETAAVEGEDSDEEAAVGRESGTTGLDSGPAEGSPADQDPDAAEDDGAGFIKKTTSFARGRIVIEEFHLEDPLRELELSLLQNDVAMPVVDDIVENIREDLLGGTRTVTQSTADVVEDAIADALLSVIEVGQFDFDRRIRAADKPVVIIFTGVNGVGKTTTIAKLSEYFADRGLSSVLANGDTYRAGANEQLQQHADALGRPVISHEQGGDPAAVIYDAVEYAESNDIDVVLGDTAGRLHTSEGLMDQLAKIDRVVDPDLTLFVDEAVAGQDAVHRAREFDDAASIDGTVLTKADADASGGAAISIAHETGKPILFLGTGQGYDDVEPFDPEELVDRLLAEE